MPIFLFFLKVGSILFGSGYVLLAFLRADLVDRWHWLSSEQLLDAIAVGQVTPGPVFTTATFVGYVLAGDPGSWNRNHRDLSTGISVCGAKRIACSAHSKISHRRGSAGRRKRGITRVDGGCDVATLTHGDRRCSNGAHSSRWNSGHLCLPPEFCVAGCGSRNYRNLSLLGPLVVGSFEIWKRALPTWTATPAREVVGAVYDRAFSCRTEDVLHRYALLKRRDARS